jgi:HEPN domain-containing protein
MNRAAAAKWLKQALHDLDMAGKNVGLGGYDTAAFLAHQSVEKLLKALFAAQGRPAPRMHFIDELAEQLDLPAAVSPGTDIDATTETTENAEGVKPGVRPVPSVNSVRSVVQYRVLG